jgi:hypothetical protein
MKVFFGGDYINGVEAIASAWHSFKGNPDDLSCLGQSEGRVLSEDNLTA